MDDLWPIGTEFFLRDFTTNCDSYDSSDIEQRRARAKKFVEVSKCPYPVYCDTETDNYNKNLHAWPDKYYLVDQDLNILYKSQYSYRERAKIEIDCIWMIEFFQYVRAQVPDADIKAMVNRMVKSYFHYVDKNIKNKNVEDVDTYNPVAMGNSN